MKLIDADLRCCLSQENLARCTCIGKFQELLGRDYPALFPSWMDTQSTNPGRRKAASRLEHN